MIEYDNNNNTMEVSIETVCIPVHPHINRGGAGVSNMDCGTAFGLCRFGSDLHVPASRMGMVPLPRHSNTKTTTERVH